MVNKNNEIIASSQTVMVSGPLPSAEEFSKYEQSIPGTAERILVMAESEVKHRHEVEKIAVKTTARLNTSGQILGFILSVLSLGAVGLSIFFAQPAASIAPAIVAITGLVSIFTNRK